MNATATQIKNRREAKDIFITPTDLAKKHIDIVKNILKDTIDCGEDCELCGGVQRWYDPFRATGRYFDNFPEGEKTEKVWSEITDGKDFFEEDEGLEPTAIVSNPPYSNIQAVLEHSVNLNPLIISYLLGLHNLTPKRIEYMENNGYKIVNIHMCKVFKWFGMSAIITWERSNNKKGIIDYDRTVWRE
jgi:hypothetical protein